MLLCHDADVCMMVVVCTMLMFADVGRCAADVRTCTDGADVRGVTCHDADVCTMLMVCTM